MNIYFADLIFHFGNYVMHSVLVLVLFCCVVVNLVLSQRYDVHRELGNVSHLHQKSYSVGVMPEAEPPFAVAFMCGACALAVPVRLLWVRVRVRLPYCAVLFVAGALLGWAASAHDAVHAYTRGLCDMSPKHLMMLFLPALVFRTAFCVDAHAFRRGLRMILVISVAGFLAAALLTALMAKGLFFGGWSWELAVLFAAIATTSYPQDVILLLREHGQSKQLSTLLEGEGLLVDGSAIVVFNILLGYVTGYVTDALHITILCAKFIFVGPLLGYIIGKITACALVRIFNDVVSTATITLVVAFASYYVAEEVIGVSGVLCCVVIGVVLGGERLRLSAEVDAFLQLFWELIAFLASALLFLMAGVLIFEAISAKIEARDLVVAIVLYLTCFLSRAVMYASVKMAWRGAGGARLTSKDVVVLVAAHLRGPVSLCLALAADKAEGMAEEGAKILIYISALVLLTQVINGSTLQLLLKTLGLLRISLAKRANMNSAIKYLVLTRERSLNMVKMDRHLAGANWMIVQEATRITHPYKSLSEKGNDLQITFTGYHIALCPECQKEVLAEPTKAEFEEMQKEANIRILKAKKVSYCRQYEHGLLSKEAIHVLASAVEAAGDREGAVMEVEDLRGRWERRTLAALLRRRLVALMVRADADAPALALAIARANAPHQRATLHCYKIATSKWFFYLMLYMITFNVITIILDMVYDPEPGTELYLAILILNHFFCAVFLAEFIIKCIGLGIKKYFTSFMNVLDFIILIVQVIHLILHYSESYILFIHSSIALYTLETIGRLFPVLRLIRFLKFLRVCIPRIILLLDSYLDVQLRRSYDVGKGFVIGEEEILKILVHIVDNKKIYAKIKDKIEDDRLAVSKKLGIIQKDYPEIAVTVKTRQAIRTILNKIQEAVKELKDGGLLDDFEYTKCKNIVEKNLNYLRTHCQKIESCPPHVLLQEVPWVSGDRVLEEFLFEKTRPISFNYGEVVIAHGSVPESLYIILYGVVKLVYVPSEQTLKNLRTLGALPNVDYVTTLRFEERQEELVLPGNVVGELGVLTGRLYDASAACETSVQAYEISLGAMLEAMALSPHRSTGLKARLWKAVALRVAHVILSNTPHYQSWSQDDLKYHLERAIVPTLSQASILTVSELIEDVLLIEGQVMDANSRKIYFAPCYIPRTVHKLIFPRNSLMNVSTMIETKLLIIPVKHCDEVDVLEDGRGLRIVSSTSALCLQHSVLQRDASRGAAHRHKKSDKELGSRWSGGGGGGGGSALTAQGRGAASAPSDLMPWRSASSVWHVYSVGTLTPDAASERLQNVIDAVSWGSDSRSRSRSYSRSLSVGRASLQQVDGASRVVRFDDEEPRSEHSLGRRREPSPRGDATTSQASAAAERLGLSASGESGDWAAAAAAAAEPSPGPGAGQVVGPGAGPGTEARGAGLVLPFKRVFMPDIAEEQDEDEDEEEDDV